MSKDDSLIKFLETCEIEIADTDCLGCSKLFTLIKIIRIQQKVINTVLELFESLNKDTISNLTFGEEFRKERKKNDSKK